MGWLPGATPAGAAGPRVPLTITSGAERFFSSGDASSYVHSTAPMGADVSDRVGVYCASLGGKDVGNVELGDPYNSMNEAGLGALGSLKNSAAIWYLATDGLGEGTEPRIRVSSVSGNADRFYGYPLYINGSLNVWIHDVATTSAGGILSVQTVPGCAVLGLEANDDGLGRSMAWTGGTDIDNYSVGNGNWRIVAQSDVDGGVISTNSLASDSSAVLVAFRGW